jgi:hypothetical protein
MLELQAQQFAELAWGSIHSRTEGVESVGIRNSGIIIDATAAGEVCQNCGKVHGKGRLAAFLAELLG